MANERLLIVEEDRDLSYIAKIQLKRRGFCVSCAPNYKRTQELMKNNEFDLVILDTILPDADGIEVCMEIKKTTRCPIIFMSCIGDRETIISALEKGGDDYVVKPIDVDLLAARIHANIRKTKQYPGVKFRHRKDLYFNGFMIEQSSHTVYKTTAEGKKFNQIALSPTEYKLLILFTENMGNLLSYEEIYRCVWKTDAWEDIRTVMVHVSNLRRKINNCGNNMIHTVRGTGYMFNNGSTEG